MKKLLLVLLTCFTLNSTSQTICDSVVVSGSAWQLVAGIGTPGPTIILVDYWLTTDPLGNVLGQDSITSYHTASANTPQDTVVMCLTVSFSSPWFSPGTCCLVLVWDGTTWVKHYISNLPSGLQEIQYIENDDRVYDLLGRELFTIPKNTIYIKNNKLYIEN